MKKLLILMFLGMLAFNAGAVISYQNNVTTRVVTVKNHTKKIEKVKTYLKAVSSGEKSGVVAAILCLVLGGIGVHRVYMGSKPIMILWYILTLGGLFGILPLIDFFRLLLGSSKHYENNDKLFAAFS